MYALHQLHDMMCADMDDNSDVYGREYRKAAIPNLLHRATPKIFSRRTPTPRIEIPTKI
jgi:hypothetical protein